MSKYEIFEKSPIIKIQISDKYVGRACKNSNIPLFCKETYTKLLNCCFIKQL